MTINSGAARVAPATVAVVTRTADRPLMLKRARTSVMAQTFRDFVWTVINNGGDPAPVEIEIAAARAAGLHAIVIHNQTRIGMESASNLGVHASLSRHVAIHDDDDSWEPGFLATLVAALESAPRFIGAVCHTAMVTEAIKSDGIVRLDRRPQNQWLEAVQLADLAIANLFPPISFLYRRESYDAVAGYDESFPVLGDWEFNLKMALRGDILVVPKILANYHVRSGDASAISAYANSITSQRDVHRLQDALFRNRMLRADLASNRLGVGWMLMCARLQHQGRRTVPLVPRSRLNAANGILAALGRRFFRRAGPSDPGLKS